MIKEVEEKEIEELYYILVNTFNNKMSLQKFKEFYQLSIENKDTHILGYYKKDVLVGTLLFNILVMPNGKEMTIWNVAVKEECRGQGIATKLMKEAEEFAKKDKDIGKIWLFSGYHREIAHKLYRKMGYDENRDKAFIKEIHK